MTNTEIITRSFVSTILITGIIFGLIIILVEV